jgi:hypothetical protein
VPRNVIKVLIVLDVTAKLDSTPRCTGTAIPITSTQNAAVCWKASESLAVTGKGPAKQRCTCMDGTSQKCREKSIHSHKPLT